MRKHDPEKILKGLASEFAAFLPSLERLSNELRINLSLEHTGGHDPHVLLSWTNPRQYICNVSITKDTVRGLSMVALCWGPKEMLGRKIWKVKGVTPTDLEQAIREAHQWAQGIQ